ncbi:MAG: hypothetical protein E6I87_10045 [Chloroflexi bacterium]|nr:MAG: hypothetical protein E6I87_10045 [Chloroflexota bacterium]
MARRIPLPRLSRRQRMARWQRERRQQFVYLTLFTALLVFVIGLVGWAAASSYYDANLIPAAKVGDRAIPTRDFNRMFAFEKTRFFIQYGLQPGSESDPQVASAIQSLRKSALDELLVGETLMTVARADNAVPSQADIDTQLNHDFSELHVRHILVAPDANEKDTAKADADAKAKAEDAAKQLKADPKNDQLWKDLAAKDSTDTGTKDQGGDLGWVSVQSGFVKEFEDAMFALKDGEVSDPVKSQFGYHVIQRIETRGVTDTPLYSSLRASGLNLADLRLVSRSALLQKTYTDKAKNAPIASPQDQVHLADIVINIPTPTSSNLQDYATAQKKITDVLTALNNGQDFAEVAKANSEDTVTKDSGGDMGWLTRGMLPNKTIADDVFAKNAGERSDQHSLNTSGNVVIYKVLEKASKDVTDDQKKKIQDGAYDLWYADQQMRLNVVPLVPGLEFP